MVGCWQIWTLFRATRCSTLRQLKIVDLNWNSFVTWQKHTVKCIVKIRSQISAQSFDAFRRLVECSFTNKMIVGSRLIAVTYTSHFAPASSNELLTIQTATDCGFNLKFLRDMTKISSQVHSKGKYSHLTSIIWWLGSNGWVFADEVNASGFETNCSYLKFRFRSCFEQGDVQHSENYRLWV